MVAATGQRTRTMFLRVRFVCVEFRLCYLILSCLDSLKWYISRNNAGLTSAGFTSFSAAADALTVTFYDQV